MSDEKPVVRPWWCVRCKAPPQRPEDTRGAFCAGCAERVRQERKHRAERAERARRGEANWRRAQAGDS